MISSPSDPIEVVIPSGTIVRVGGIAVEIASPTLIHSTRGNWQLILHELQYQSGLARSKWDKEIEEE